MAVGKPISKKDLQDCDKNGIENDKVKALTGILDERIYATYKLYPNNYIAADMQAGNNAYASHYTEKEKQDFQAYVEKCISKIEGDREGLKKIFLTMYANPVANTGK